MLTTEEIEALVRAHAPGFRVAVRTSRQGDRVYRVVELAHPASIGAQLAVPATHELTSSGLEAWLRGNPEVERLHDAPALTDPGLCRDLYIRSQVFRWSRSALRSQAESLVRAGKLRPDEVAWILSWPLEAHEA